MRRVVRLGGSSLVMVWALAGASAQEGSPQSNLTLIRGLLARAADSVVTVLAGQPPGGVTLQVRPPEIAWLAEEQFSNRLRQSEWPPFSGPHVGWSLLIVVDEISVVYSDPREGGLFASGLLDRTVGVAVRVRATSGESAEPAVDVRYTPTVRDTIASTDVEFVETSYLPFTQGRVPQGGFFSSLLEPVVVIGTIAVAVLLLFTVRSS